MKHFFYDFAGYNVILFNKINNIFGRDESYVLTFADQLGFYRSFPIVLSLLLIYCYFSIITAKVNKKLYEKTALHWANTLATLAASLFVMLCIISFIKGFCAYKRPFCHEDVQNIKIFKSALISAECNRSFPSGHTAYICTILFSIWPVLNYLSKGIGIFLAVSVALSRIASGVHFPADVFWSALLSLVVVISIHKIIKFYITGKYSKRVLQFARSIF